MSDLDKYLAALRAVFRQASDKREANYRCREVLVDMSGDRGVLTEVLSRHLRKKDSLNTLHYPVVGLDIELNEYYGLVANCWIPLPGRETNISTKSIHHHGNMLLSTVTAHGTGYEHWTFETPAVVDADQEVYSLKLIEHAQHPLHHVAFVDSYVAHLPFYPSGCTVTYALWSDQFPTTWRQRVKRLPSVQNYSTRLRKIADRIGMKEMLQLNVIEYFDFYPCADGFRGMRERKEFERSNNQDYLYSVFYILQQTNNEQLAGIIESKLSSSEVITDRELVRKLLVDLKSGTPIEGRLSKNHVGLEYANFTRQQIFDALAVQH